MWLALEWIERHCVVPDGFRKGAPFRLYEYQGRYLTNFYLVKGDAEWVPDAPVLAPAFVHRRAMIVGPQGLGKDPLAAAHICNEGVGPALFAGFAGRDEGYVCREHGCRCGWEYPYDEGEPRGMPWPTPLIQITAFSEEQTDNTYDVLRPMIDLGPLADVIPKTGESFVRLPGGGRIDTVTSSAQSRLGQRTTFISQGEVGIWTASNKMLRLADTQYRGVSKMGGRVSANTNAWDPTEHSVAQLQFESTSTDVYRQFVQAPVTLSYGDKRERRKIHRIVYPADTRRENGGHVDLDAIEAEATDLYQRDPRQAMRFYGNMLVAGAGRAVEPETWDALSSPRDVPQGTHIGLGFDGSINQDATFLRGCTAYGYSFIIGAWERPEGAPPEWMVPRNEVHEKLAWAFDYYSVGRLVADPPKWWTEVDDWTATYGMDANGEPRVIALDTNQHKARFSVAVDRWLTAIGQSMARLDEMRGVSGPVELPYSHDDDLATAEHVKAAHLQKLSPSADDLDGRSRFVIVKGADRKRIDGAVAEILALEAAMTMAPPVTIPTPRFIPIGSVDKPGPRTFEEEQAELERFFGEVE
jgi:hypothetical protein